MRGDAFVLMPSPRAARMESAGRPPASFLVAACVSSGAQSAPPNFFPSVTGWCTLTRGNAGRIGQKGNLGLSVEATTWVWDHSPETDAARWVLMCLADYADKTGAGARPSVETIAGRVKISERHVRRTLSELRDRGAIRPTGIHKSGVTVYQIEMPLTPCQGDAHVSRPKRPPDAGVTPPLTPVSSDPPMNHPVGVSNETPTRRPRARDPIWDALILIEGVPQTQSERSRLNAACKQFRDAGVDPDLIPLAARRYRKEWPNAALTAHALAANITRFTNGYHANGHKPSVECPHCGTLPSTIRLVDHLADVHGERTP